MRMRSDLVEAVAASLAVAGLRGSVRLDRRKLGYLAVGAALRRAACGASKRAIIVGERR